ncbi:MAG: hypothetical protein KDE55_25150, partial [Novosphingobium sp.]|nr:hypothetical protein [Novosphingobium sp.]
GTFWRDEMPLPAEQDQAEEGINVEKEAPAWLVSLVLHLLVLLILALLASPYGRNMTSIVLDMGSSNDEGDALESFELAAETPEIADTNPEDTTFTEIEPVEIPDQVLAAESLIEAMPPIEANITGVAVPIASMMSGRQGASKDALLAAYGGTPVTEDAVQLGLKWLARQQEAKGSWSLMGPYSDGAGSENRLAATAMAMLAFQGNGNTHLSGPYRKNLEKAVKWLVSQQDRTGYMGKNLPRHQKMYAQAQATIALCELYGMTHDSWLREPAQKAINFAVSSQSSLGGWRYEPKQDSDTSVTGWFVMALSSGRSAELDVNESAMRAVHGFLDAAQSYDGAGYGYQMNSGPSKAMTAEGMLCRQYLGWGKQMPQMAICCDSLVSPENIFNIDDQDFYYWYYATQVLHHYGGSPWREWNERMRVQLPQDQIKLGREEGSWAPQRSRWGVQAGRLYTTCMAIYCLEVYYRHMPLYDMEMK